MATITRDDMQLYVDQLVNWFDKSTDAQRTEGRAWYPFAGQLARTMANGDIRLGAGVIAAFSTNAEWKANLTMARRAIAGNAAGMGIPLAETARMMAGEDFDSVLPYMVKRWNFAHNVAGDLSKVTIDRWAIRAALGCDGSLGSRAARKDGSCQYADNYAIMEEAYRQAAAICGELPANFQAIVWVTIKAHADAAKAAA